MKLLTITVPSYNVEKTLHRTLGSLCLSAVAEYLDIIIVDDGSTDHTLSIATKYAEKHPQSVRVISKLNGGHGSAVNTGIEAARGSYFKVVDGDDILEEEGLIALIKRLETTQADIIASNYKKVTLNVNTDAVNMRFDMVCYNKTYNFDDLPFDKNIYFGIHSMTIKTSILQSNPIKLQEHTYYVDAEYGLLPIPFIKTVEFMKEYVYIYHIGNPGQSIAAENFVKKYDDHYRVVKRMTEYAMLCEANAGQAGQIDYMYSALMKLCFTNYMLAVFYDNDIARGRTRAREFDGWLHKTNIRLYRALGKSLYIRFLRSTGFVFVPRGEKLKVLIRKIYSVFKPLFKKKQRLTY